MATKESGPAKGTKRHHEEADTWAELIHEKTVKDLVKQKDCNIITFQGSLTLGQALDVLQKNNILSAPVLNEKREFMGFVDVLDIAGYTLQSYNSEYTSLPEFKKRDYAKDEFFHVKISELINFSGVDPSIFVRETDSISHLIHIFCKHKLRSRLHRVAVLDKDMHVVNIISQTDILRFASLHAEVFPEVKMSDIDVIHAPIMVRLDSPFYNALEILYRNRISGLALMDDQGHLSANLSASDLRGITQKAFSYFSGSVLQFLTKATKSTLIAPITCSPDATLAEVIKLMVHKQIHRVYIVNENSYPLGVISVTDLLRVLHVENKKKHKKH